MPHELDRYAGLSIDRLLEREDHEHLLHETLEHRHTAGTSRPDLRADEVERGHARVPRQRQHAAIESVVIHADDRGRTTVPDELLQPPCEAQEKPDLQRGLPEPRHATRRQVLEELVRGGTTEGAADGRHADGGIAMLQRPNQARRVKIA